MIAPLLLSITTLLPAADSAAESTRRPSQTGLEAAAAYSEEHAGQTMLVLHNGNTVFERYANGGSPETRQMLASGSKSFVGVAATAAVHDGILKLDDKACESLTEWANDPEKSRITYRQLLTLTSGLTAGDVRRARNGPSWDEIISLPLTSSPGEKFEYGAYQLNAFAYALERTLDGETFEHYLERRVFNPLGVTVEWRFRCADDHPQVGGGAFMTARDWGTFGEWVRLEGAWHGQELIGKAALAECFRGTQQNPAYGLAWWLKEPVSRRTLWTIPLLRREFSGVLAEDAIPDDFVAACGAGKQRLYVIPSLQLVVVRQGSLRGSQSFEDDEFLRRLLATPVDNP